MVLCDRRQLSNDGFTVRIVAVDEFDGEVIYGPEIISRGFAHRCASRRISSAARRTPSTR